MKKLLLLSFVLFLSGCSCGKEDEDFSPYPGGKQEKITPKAKS